MMNFAKVSSNYRVFEENDRWVITGGSGFLGLNLISTLACVFTLKHFHTSNREKIIQHFFNLA